MTKNFLVSILLIKSLWLCRIHACCSSMPSLVATLLLNLFFELGPLCNAGHNPLVPSFHPFWEKSVDQAIETSWFEPDP